MRSSAARDQRDASAALISRSSPARISPSSGVLQPQQGLGRPRGDARRRNAGHRTGRRPADRSPRTRRRPDSAPAISVLTQPLPVSKPDLNAFSGRPSGACIAAQIGPVGGVIFATRSSGRRRGWARQRDPATRRAGEPRGKLEYGQPVSGLRSAIGFARQRGSDDQRQRISCWSMERISVLRRTIPGMSR